MKAINSVFLKRSVYFISICFLTISIASCSLFKGGGNKQYKQVTIIDPGEIYSTFGLGEDDEARKAILLNGVSFEKFQDIVAYSEEGSWPPDMKELDSRLDKRDLIMKYKVRLVTTFNDKCILVVPSSENKHMPAEMKMKRDFYIIIGREGVYQGV